jgi:hypothetical protein
LIYGWDISTSIIGVSVFTDEGKYTKSFYIDLRKIEGQLEKARAFHDWLKGTSINVENVSNHFIEERLGNFSAGHTMMQTLTKLAAFNAVVSYIIWNHNVGEGRVVNVHYLHPSSWKAVMKRDGLIIPKGSAEKKKLTLEFVRKVQPGFPYEENLNKKGNPQPWLYDLADAYCIGRSGWRKLQGLSTTSSTPLTAKHMSAKRGILREDRNST